MVLVTLFAIFGDDIKWLISTDARTGNVIQLYKLSIYPRCRLLFRSWLLYLCKFVSIGATSRLYNTNNRFLVFTATSGRIHRLKTFRFGHSRYLSCAPPDRLHVHRLTPYQPQGTVVAITWSISKNNFFCCQAGIIFRIAVLFVGAFKEFK
jgi:hypothetical protein